MRTETVP